MFVIYAATNGGMGRLDGLLAFNMDRVYYNTLKYVKP